MFRQTANRPVCLVSNTRLRPKTRVFLLSDRCGFVDMECPLWWEDRSIVYNCCWPSPEQPFCSLCPAVLMTIFYCLRFESPPTWRAMSLYLYPPGTGSPMCTPKHWVLIPLHSSTLRCTFKSASRFRLFCDRRPVGQSVLVSSPR
jgi:hypothetical protein